MGQKTGEPVQVTTGLSLPRLTSSSLSVKLSVKAGAGRQTYTPVHANSLALPKEFAYFDSNESVDPARF